MPTDPTPQLARALRDLPLKEMDPTTLSFAIAHEAHALGVTGGHLKAAVEVAAYAHRNDTRTARGTLPRDPYISHPLRNVLRLIRYGCADDDVLSATALHDTVEDAPDQILRALGIVAPEPADAQRSMALDQLATHFGQVVAALVSAVTNPPRPEGVDDDARRQAYAEHVAAVITDPAVFLVKFADYIDNAGSLRYLTDPAKRTRLSHKYRPLIEVFRSQLSAHGNRLGVSETGYAEMHGHLESVSERLDADVRAQPE